MCAECLRKLVTLALVFASVDAVVGTEATHPPEGAQDRAPQQKGRMSLQNSGTRLFLEDQNASVSDSVSEARKLQFKSRTRCGGIFLIFLTSVQRVSEIGVASLGDKHRSYRRWE